MASHIGSPTQNFVPLKEVRDGFVILKDGTLLSILITSSINFALKSSEEQQAILFQFQNFLNSLDFSIQFFIESRRFDIKPYIALLEDRNKENVSDLMKIQIQEYMNFIKNFTDSTNIMTKSFFVVVPYSSTLVSKGNRFAFLHRKNKEEEEKVEMENFQENRQQAEERVSIVEQGLQRCGVRTIQLGTDEVTELFYKLFNPGETDKHIVLNK